MGIGSSIRCAAPDWLRAGAQISRAVWPRSRPGRAPRRGSFLGVELPLPFGGPSQQACAMRFESPAIERRLIRCGFRSRPHFDAIDRARRQAQFTARAALDENGVHVFCGPDDGVHRTGRKAARAADAAGFVDPRDPRRTFRSVNRVQGLHGPAREFGQRDDGCVAARRALIDLRLSAHDCRGIRLAPGITATRALSLRQQCVDARRDVRRRLGGHAI